ncbi:MAG: vWA domain-containing protein [Bacteroidales bacterium]
MKHGNLLLLSSLALMLGLFQACSELDDPSTGEKDGSSTGYLTDSAYGLTGGESGSGSGGEGTGGDGGQYQAGVLTAGEWNDLENWDFWLDLQQMEEFGTAQENWSFYPFERYSFQVADAQGDPVMDATVELLHDGDRIWTGRTDNLGRAECWANALAPAPGAGTLQYRILMNSVQIASGNAMEYSDGVNSVEATADAPVRDEADIMFVVDATGSMGDELEYLKVELTDVLNKAADSVPNLNLRYGSVFYRDLGDEYVTRSHAFNSDVQSLMSFVGAQSADGGGDYEEAVEMALEEAVTQHSWSSSARARILFLLLDAPPHLESSIAAKLHEVIPAAAAKGIRIVPIAASGVNRDTEFLLRFFATLTNGTYTFVTDVSGVGNDHLEPTTGEYEDEKLNDLLLRIITEFCQ